MAAYCMGFRLRSPLPGFIGRAHHGLYAIVMASMMTPTRFAAFPTRMRAPALRCWSVRRKDRSLMTAATVMPTVSHYVSRDRIQNRSSPVAVVALAARCGCLSVIFPASV